MKPARFRFRRKTVSTRHRVFISGRRSFFSVGPITKHHIDFVNVFENNDGNAKKNNSRQWVDRNGGGRAKRLGNPQRRTHDEKTTSSRLTKTDSAAWERRLAAEVPKLFTARPAQTRIVTRNVCVSRTACSTENSIRKVFYWNWFVSLLQTINDKTKSSTHTQSTLIFLFFLSRKDLIF